MAPVVDKTGMVSGTIAPYIPTGVTRDKGGTHVKSPEFVDRPAQNSQESNSKLNDSSTVKKEPPGEEQLPDAASIKQQLFDNKLVRIEFDKDQDSGQVIIRMIDRESGEVVREFPSEELRHVAKVLRQLADKVDKGKKGQLVDKVVT